MNFIFDIDDTLCDTDGYSEKFILEFFKNNNLPYKQIAKDVRYAEQKFDWSFDDAISWYKTYGDTMFPNFPCTPKAIETINHLHSLGHKIIIATARSTNWHSEPEKYTYKWLEINKIYYDKIYFSVFDKENICKQENADVLIDDDLDITAKVAKDFEGQPNKFVFLKTTNYNKLFDTPNNVIRINTIDEILNYIK